MIKHVHVYLGGVKPIVRRTVDAKPTKDCGCGGHSETDDATAHDPANGQFTTGSGGGNAAHHHERSEAHRKESHGKEEQYRKGGEHHPDFPDHLAAIERHAEAGHSLAAAEQSDPGEGGYKVRGKNREGHMKEASEHASAAARHEAAIAARNGGGGEATKSKKSGKESTFKSLNGKHTKPGGDHPHKMVVKARSNVPGVGNEHAPWMTMSRNYGEHKVKEGSHDPVHHNELNKRTIID